MGLRNYEMNVEFYIIVHENIQLHHLSVLTTYLRNISYIFKIHTAKTVE